jgi:hypothetical protein
LLAEAGLVDFETKEAAMADPEELKKIAEERMRDLPGETAAGRIDPATLPEDEREELAKRVPRADDDEQA